VKSLKTKQEDNAVVWRLSSTNTNTKLADDGNTLKCSATYNILDIGFLGVVDLGLEGF